MKTLFRNILAVVLGVFIGGGVNMGLILLGGALIPPPQGVDPNDMESLKTSMHLFEAKHFLFPFLAHALGTLAGALSAAWIAVTYRRTCALLIGLVFLAGGIAAAVMLPAPAWFIATDLVLAYLPMAWLGFWLVTRAARATRS